MKGYPDFFISQKNEKEWKQGKDERSMASMKTNIAMRKNDKNQEKERDFLSKGNSWLATSEANDIGGGGQDKVRQEQI